MYNKDKVLERLQFFKNKIDKLSDIRLWWGGRLAMGAFKERSYE